MRITTTLGASAPACGGSAHQGVDSASVRPIVPSNRSYRCIETSRVATGGDTNY